MHYGQRKKDNMFFFFAIKEKNQKENAAWYFRNPHYRLSETVSFCENKGGFLVSSFDNVFRLI